MATITISEDLKRELLRVAAQLQSSRGEKIDYDDVLRYLVGRATRSTALFRKAVSPTRASSGKLKRELSRSREMDRKKEKRLGERVTRLERNALDSRFSV